MKSLKLGLIATALVATAGATMAADVNPYVLDSSNQVVKSGFGLCVRTSYWTPALAQEVPEGCKCDGDVLKCNAAPAAPAPKAKKPQKVTLNADALFAFGSAKISSEGASSLNKLIAQMAGVNVQVILVTGYTDQIGKDSFNFELSKKRADAVKDYLANAGVNEEVIRPDGLGPENPVVQCDSNLPSKELVKCMAPNRRAELEVFGTRAAQ